MSDAEEFAAAENPEEGGARQNAKDLFTFLKEFTELRMRAVRSVDQYDSVLWLSEVPREKGCSCAAWDRGDEEGQHGETWLEIGKPRLFPPPQPGPLLEPWLIAEQITDSSRDMPEIRDEISVRSEDGDGEERSFERRRIEDFPQVEEMLAKYIEDQWRPWAEIDKRLKLVQHVYTDLFTIYQRQQRLGEQYEVVLGLGLLVWRTPDGQNVQRHLITAQTNIEFEAARGLIRLGPAGEGARPVLEQDMLDARHRPEPSTLRALESEASEIADDIWNRAKLHSVLAGWVNAVSPSGESDYRDTLARPNGLGSDPRVHLAPAIVLRKRTEQGYVRAFQEIIHQLDGGVEVPPALKHFVIPADQRGADINADETGPAGGTPEIYFPLEANDAQREIVKRLQTHQGVLVQGPPGTGKSHTIVNLICHLLASGKRVLVTSHTARALTVLKRFLSERTPEVAPLAVVVLGDDRESLEAMEISVQGIMDRHNQWNAAANERKVAEAERALSGISERHADTLNTLRSLRERETYKHPLRFESYQGTLQRIGEQLRGERPQYGWIADRPSEDAEPPLSDDEAQTLLRLLRDRALDDAHSWNWKPIDPSILLAPARFQALVDQERTARRQYDDTEPDRGHPAYKGLLNAPADVRKELSKGFGLLLKEVDEITRQLHKWTGRMLQEILGDLDRPWRELFEITRSNLLAIDSRARWADETNMSGLDGREFTRVRADAKDLLRHLEAKGGWGIPGFRSHVVKRGLYLREEVRLNGRPCETKEVLRDLISWVDVVLRLDQLDRAWQPVTKVVSTTFAGKAKEYEDLCEPLERGLGLHIGIGGRLATPPLPHHRTYGSVSGGSAD